MLSGALKAGDDFVRTKLQVYSILGMRCICSITWILIPPLHDLYYAHEVALHAGKNGIGSKDTLSIFFLVYIPFANEQGLVSVLHWQMR